MKKLQVLIFSFLMIFSLSSCRDIRQSECKNIWNITLNCMEESKENSYIINWADKAEEKIISKAGKIKIENRNDFPIVVHISSQGEKEKVVEIDKKDNVFLEILKDTPYVVGIHADVEIKTPIMIQIQDEI